MTWAKLSDDFADDCDSLSDAAFRLHVEGLVWNGRKLRNCRLPKSDLARFATHPEAVAELLAVGWWTEEREHFLIRHHAGYQRTREQVLKQQEVNSQNGRRGGRPRGRERVEETESVSEPVSEPQSESVRTETESVTEVGSVETERLSEPLTESESERDGPGQDRNGSYGEEPSATVNGWPTAPTCLTCKGPMFATELGQTSHPNCVPVPAGSRA